MQKVKPGIYKHFKGHMSEVIGEAKHTEKDEYFVVYWHVNDETGENMLWARPKAMFLETVAREGKTVPRFELVEETES